MGLRVGPDRAACTSQHAGLAGRVGVCALLPSLVGWFVVAPLKGQPIAAGWNVARLWIAPVVNGLWGLGTALLYELLTRLGSGRRAWVP